MTISTVKFILLMILITAPLIALPRHYFVLCGYQNESNEIEASHTFARFIEVSDNADIEKQIGVKFIDISWLPHDFEETMTLKPFWKQKRGRDFSFEDTLRFARQKNCQVTCLGVHSMPSWAFEKVEKRNSVLESGRVKYQVLDNKNRRQTLNSEPTGSCNCIHAVSDMAGVLVTGTAHGLPASRLVQEHFEKNGFVLSCDGTEKTALQKYLDNLINGFPH